MIESGLLYTTADQPVAKVMLRLEPNKPCLCLEEKNRKQLQDANEVNEQLNDIQEKIL